ncbi:hypothetical protein GALL_93360 [mine drainage metagenome]|uniref:DUF1854 domain-containing protein n=1 Tax=mine drainage metagenome TaxID=410659 RepID=A0A1J5T8T6_9ZZZZ
MSDHDFKLTRNAAGRLVLTAAEGDVHEGVVPVRAFPISAPDEGVSLLGEDGHELRWVSRLSDLPEVMRILIEAELAQREFMPEITRIRQVSSFATPSKWQVSTDRGDTELLLKAEDHIRRLANAMLLITDGYGVSFLIRDTGALDRHSRKLLDRFL